LIHFYKRCKNFPYSGADGLALIFYMK